MKANTCIIYFLIVLIFSCQENPKGMTFKEAEAKGLFFDSLNVIYKGVTGVDTSDSAFKTDAERELAQISYQKFLNDLSENLKLNNFKWPFAITCFQMTYFNTEGGIDYFLFNFLAEPPYKLSTEQERKFKQIVNSFIQEYHFPVCPERMYSRCGTIEFGMHQE